MFLTPDSSLNEKIVWPSVMITPQQAPSLQFNFTDINSQKHLFSLPCHHKNALCSENTGARVETAGFPSRYVTKINT